MKEQGAIICEVNVALIHVKRAIDFAQEKFGGGGK